MNKYLIYVTQFSFMSPDHRRLLVYEYSGDPFHAMGEIMFRSFQQIYYITFVEDTPQKREYWDNEGVKITPWRDKYGNYARVGKEKIK